MSTINLTNVNKTHAKARITYSYPAVQVTKRTNQYTVQYSGDNYFEFSDDGAFIRGGCAEISVIKPTHNIQLGVGIEQDAELVFKHTTTSNTYFYVVIPLVQDGNSIGAEFDKISEEAATGVAYNLNNDLKRIRPSIVCYKNNSKNSEYVFVFNKPIVVKEPISGSKEKIFSGVKTSTTGKGKRKKTTSTAFLVKNSQNVEDEIQCEYVTQTDANVNPASRRTVTDIFVWFSFTLGLILGFYYLLKVIQGKVNDPETIYKGIGGVGFLLLITYIRLFSNTATKKIQYGSMMVFSLAVIILSLYAFNGGFAVKP